MVMAWQETSKFSRRLSPTIAQPPHNKASSGHHADYMAGDQPFVLPLISHNSAASI